MKKLKVAFDCSGTLLHHEGSRQLFKWFKDKGAEMIIWSSAITYTVDAAKMLGVWGDQEVKLDDKIWWSPDPEDQKDFVDVAVDDRGWIDKKRGIPSLGTHFVIDVMDIPKNPEAFESTYGYLFVGHCVDCFSCIDPCGKEQK